MPSEGLTPADAAVSTAATTAAKLSHGSPSAQANDAMQAPANDASANTVVATTASPASPLVANAGAEGPSTPAAAAAATPAAAGDATPIPAAAPTVTAAAAAAPAAGATPPALGGPTPESGATAPTSPPAAPPAVTPAATTAAAAAAAPPAGTGAAPAPTPAPPAPGAAVPPAGSSDDTDEKREALRQALLAMGMGALMRDGWVDSACLGRYLRARKGNVSKAAKLLQSTLQWRDDINTPPMSIAEFEPEIKSGKIYVHGNDAAGRTVLVTRKRSDAFKAGEYDHYLRHLAFTLDTACRNMQGGAEAWVWIMDMAGMTRANSPPINVSLATLRIMADHFPERLCRCFFVDAPAVFNYLWAALSPFIDPTTRKKIVFIKSAEWRKKMDSNAGGAQLAKDPLDFSHYWGVYNTPYNEAAYRQLLTTLGWPESA